MDSIAQEMDNHQAANPYGVIKAYNEDRTEGNGFAFTNYNAHEMLYVIKDAIFTFAKKDEWEKIVKFAIKSDFGWDKSSEKYIELFDSLK